MADITPADVLVPFSYVQILSATVFGLVVFQGVPDHWTLLGIALVTAAGVLYSGGGQELHEGPVAV